MASYDKQLIEEKNKQRMALKREYLKQITNPHVQGGGHVFDPALQRYISMKNTRIEFFRETPKTSLMGFLSLVVPFAFVFWMFNNDRVKREAAFRRGEVAYKDRDFKFQ